MTGETTQELSYLEKLDDLVWRTRGARFNAMRRLRSRRSWSLWSAATASVYLMLLNGVPLVDPNWPHPGVGKWLSLASIGLSVAILVMTLLEAGQDYGKRAEDLHRCGRELSRLRRKIKHLLGTRPTVGLEETLGEIETDYSNILEKYGNHEPVDDDRFMASYPGDFPKLNGLARWWACQRYRMASFGLYLLIILAPPLVLVLAYVI